VIGDKLGFSTEMIGRCVGELDFVEVGGTSTFTGKEVDGLFGASAPGPVVPMTFG
jgi:hypothetical protein